MSKETILSPSKLGRKAHDEVRGSRPLYDSKFCDDYLTDEFHITEQFDNMNDWLYGYRQASYDLYDQQKSKKKSKKSKVIDQKTNLVKDSDLPF